MISTDDLILMPEVCARRALLDRRLHISVLAPLGNHLGRGALRVLRIVTNQDESLDMIVGYESYERIEPSG